MGKWEARAFRSMCLMPTLFAKHRNIRKEYWNLLVRVAGYNAYFVGLGKEIWDELIACESHQLG